MAYPISGFYENKGKEISYKTFSVPQEGTLVSNIEVNKLLQQSLAFQPGYSIVMEENESYETWEVFTDAANQTYINCRENGSIAYFVNNGAVFYFTNFYGNKSSLLYQLYLCLFKVVLSYMPQVTIKDAYPLSVVKAPLIKWVQDLTAPFMQLIKPVYMLNYSSIDDENFTTEIALETIMLIEMPGSKKVMRTSQILLKDGKITEVIINQKGRKRVIRCQK